MMNSIELKDFQPSSSNSKNQTPNKIFIEGNYEEGVEGEVEKTIHYPEKLKITLQELVELNQSRDVSVLNDKFGGVENLCIQLKTHLKNGLFKEEQSANNFSERIQLYGTNVYKRPPPKGFFFFVKESLKDTTMIILMVAAVISLVFGIIGSVFKLGESNGWIDSLGIFLAIFLVVVVASFNNYNKEQQFHKLSKQKDDKVIKVVRGGVEQTVSIYSLLVGDVVLIDGGDGIPADGLFLEGFNLQCDESVMTGETNAIKHDSSHPFLISGTTATDGYAKMLITAVGPHTEWGQTILKLDTEDEDTPLQEVLEKMAKRIGYVGIGASVVTFIALTIKLILFQFILNHNKFSLDIVMIFLRYVLIAITIVVVAVPEGLPLAITISLAYSMKKMVKDNNLVRHLAACETMGGATNICSDKTGTLTTNRMEVTESWIAGNKYLKMDDKEVQTVKHEIVELLAESVSVNSQAHLSFNTNQATIKELDFKGDASKFSKVDFIGNKTECSMLYMLRKDFKIDYKSVRQAHEKDIVHVYTFSSSRKRMSTVLNNSHTQFRIYTKGASEIVLRLCTHFIDSDGEIKDLDSQYRSQLENEIEDMATKGLRTICIAFKDFNLEEGQNFDNPEYDPESDLVCIGIVGIKDPLRPEVTDAVTRCKNSGITVRMITGDNILTAKHIASECGILTSDGIAIEGKDLRTMSDEEFDKIVDKLQVMARSTPSDKYDLVKKLKARGEVVAVTGDGTNDAPALKAADIGLSMGLSGTEVAKEASDMVILDDNFRSIVRAVLWGRSVYENIRKFLQFQLTVNFVALVVTFIGSLFFDGFPLTPVQMLWVNLIMDTLAALALATEPPSEKLLDRKPYGRKEALISNNMWKMILTQGTFQIIILLGLMYLQEHYFKIDSPLFSDKKGYNTLIFNTFVLIQVFNEFNSRKINNEINIFENIQKSPIFFIVIVVTIGVQFLVVTFGRSLAQTAPLSWFEWLIGFVIGALSIPISTVFRLFNVPENLFKKK